MSASPKIPAVVSGAAPFHKIGITGKNITIAVMDSGLSYHPDIDLDRILAFRDFISYRAQPYDDYSHGTHVSGIIASSKIGIAPESNLVSLKVLDKEGNGSSDIFIEGIKWLLGHHRQYDIRIVNISVGGTNAKFMGNQIMGGRHHRLLFCRQQRSCTEFHHGTRQLQKGNHHRFL